MASVSTTVAAHVPISTRRRSRWNCRWRWLVIGLPLIAAGVGVARPWLLPAAKEPVVPRALPATVSGLGRITPASDVIGVAPPTPTGAMSGARVETLLVSVGDEVEAGQVLAILDTHRGRAAYIRQAQAVIDSAKAKLALVKAGPKQEDLRVQEAMIRHSQADLADAEANFARVSKLVETKAISQAEYEAGQLRVEQCEAKVEQELSRLRALRIVRPEDVAVAEADLAQAEANLTIAEEDLRNTEVRSPISGRILKIRARSGERIGEEGLLDIGDTSVMYVVAEIYEADVANVELGQTASVRLPTRNSTGWLKGEVVGKDLEVARQDVFDNDPVADIDSRVVEVRIRLTPEDGAKVAGLSNARAEVVIQLTEATP